MRNARVEVEVAFPGGACGCLKINIMFYFIRENKTKTPVRDLK